MATRGNTRRTPEFFFSASLGLFLSFLFPSPSAPLLCARLSCAVLGGKVVGRENVCAVSEKKLVLQGLIGCVIIRRLVV